MNSITGKEYNLQKIFGPDFEYHIPAYQRPYAWTETETGTLFDDLFEFYQTEKSDDNYFLGSIVLIKEDNNRYSDVIDGQQRLTTLSILIACITDRFSDSKRKSSGISYLQDQGDELAGRDAQPRLFLREKDQRFFNNYIQNLKLNELDSLDPTTLDTEAKRHIQANCRVLRERLKNAFETEEGILGFSKFLLNRCFLVAVWTPNQASAFRVFSVMNSRGLELLPTDIIKSETIGKLSPKKQEEYTSTWEELENSTGRDGFNDVFTHTRMIFAKARAKKNLLEEFREHVVKAVSPESLIHDYLTPYTSAYVQLKNGLYTSRTRAEDINKILYWLNKTNNYDWMPPAIKFLAEHQNEPEYTWWFIKKLERLAAFLLVTARDVNHRVDRYNWILVEMESRPQSTLEDPLVNIELTEWEKEQFRKALDGAIYTMPSQRRNYIIQRLDDFVSDGGATYNSKLFTIEHVLPQTPKEDSEWINQWPDPDERKNWLNRIANLVPLTRERNSAAQNYEFEAKKTKYFQTKNGTSSYALTTQVLSVSEWTPELVRKRQKDLCEVFAQNWELNPIDEPENQKHIYKIAGRGGDATGYLVDNNSFMVQKGSAIAPTVTDGIPATYLNLRKELINNQIIQDNLFISDQLFDSVSAAAAVVLGRSANGRTEWELLDGRTIADMGN